MTWACFHAQAKRSVGAPPNGVPNRPKPVIPKARDQTN